LGSAYHKLLVRLGGGSTRPSPASPPRCAATAAAEPGAPTGSGAHAAARADSDPSRLSLAMAQSRDR